MGARILKSEPAAEAKLFGAIGADELDAALCLSASISKKSLSFPVSIWVKTEAYRKISDV